MSDTWIATEVCSLDFHSWSVTEFCYGVVKGITVDNNGYIYFSNRNSVYRIHKDNMHIEPTIIFQTTQNRWLEGIVWNRNNNNLYMCDCMTDCNDTRILEYSLDTGNLSIKDARFTYPRGIATDKKGDLYITDNCCVRKMNLSEGTVITIAGSDNDGYADGEANLAKFNYPYGLVVSDDGTIYVADMDNHCIRKIKDGIVSTIAGTPGKEGHQDGPLSQSLFNFPRGIVLDVDGNLLVGDENGVRKVDLNSQIVSTLKEIDNEVCSIYQLDAHTIIAGEENLLKLECSWKWERFLWIGKKKENASYCHLASLPKDIIREITSYLK